MEKKVKIVESFFAITNISLNPNKLKLIVINGKENEEREIILNVTIKANGKNVAVQYLGV